MRPITSPAGVSAAVIFGMHLRALRRDAEMASAGLDGRLP